MFGTRGFRTWRMVARATSLAVVAVILGACAAGGCTRPGGGEPVSPGLDGGTPPPAGVPGGGAAPPQTGTTPPAGGPPAAPPPAVKPALAWVEVRRDAAALRELQAAVDAGHRPGLLDPQDVAFDFAAQELKVSGRMSYEGSSARDDGSLEAVVVTEKGRLHLLLDKPVRPDPTGIWSVRSYAWEENE
ncbi:MAG: hypothetical protein K6T75_01050 [Acetobacteraceae bacterium]|nr:hypothetical protein [Acetobacteraceae bacterium]